MMSRLIRLSPALLIATPCAAQQAPTPRVVVPPPIVSLVKPAPPAPPAPVDADRMAAAERLVGVLHIERQYDTIFAQMIPPMAKQVFDSLKNNAEAPMALRTKLADPTQLADAQYDFAQLALAGFKARYPQLVKATAREYALEFSVAELTELIAFYEGPLGQKALAVLPGIQRRLFPIGEAAGREVGREAMSKTLDRLGVVPPEPKT